MEWPPTPAQQRKAVVGAGSALKLVLFVILAGLALRLLVGPAAYLLPPTAAPEGGARLIAAPGRERTGGGGIPSVGERFLECLFFFYGTFPLSLFLSFLETRQEKGLSRASSRSHEHTLCHGVWLGFASWKDDHFVLPESGEL